jgi:hypothetical protein
MHDFKEGQYREFGGRRGCACGDCLIGGCGCTDTGSHSECLCDRCGDGSGDNQESVRYSLADGAGHD